MSAPRSAPLQQHAGCRITKQTLLTTRLERNRRSLTFFFPYRPRNANKLLIPCNLLGFPLNPHFNPASPCRRSYQHVTSSHTMQHRANVIVSPRWCGSMPSGRAICPGNPRVLLSQGSPLQTRQAPRDSEHPRRGRASTTAAPLLLPRSGGAEQPPAPHPRVGTSFLPRVPPLPGRHGPAR